MLAHVMMAFIATFAFSIIFNAPKSELIYCGLAGGFSWFVYESVSFFEVGAIALPTFCASVSATMFSRRLSFMRKVPGTIYLIPGTLPLVPGSLIYSTMYNLITDNTEKAYEAAMNAFTASATIAVGIIAVFTLPASLFFRQK